MGVEADLETLAAQLKLGGVPHLYLAIGAGDVTLAAVVNAIERTRPPPDELAERPVSPRRGRAGKPGKGISVSGVGDLMTHMARCCRPVPPEPITGYITQGRGISVHRQDCRNLLRLQSQQPNRCVVVDWGTEKDAGFKADIRVEAYDRHGLLRDVSNMMTEERVDIVASHTLTDKRSNTAVIDMTVTIRGLEQLSRVMHRISGLPNVYAVQRRG